MNLETRYIRVVVFIVDLVVAGVTLFHLFENLITFVDRYNHLHYCGISITF